MCMVWCSDRRKCCATQETLRGSSTYLVRLSNGAALMPKSKAIEVKSKMVIRMLVFGDGVKYSRFVLILGGWSFEVQSSVGVVSVKKRVE